MGLALRPAGPQDAEVAAAVIVSAFVSYTAFAGSDWMPPADMTEPERLRERLARDGARGVLALDGERPVAFGAYEPARDGRDGPLIRGLAHVFAVFAVPEAWGTGAARAVLADLVEGMRADGFGHARLFTPALQARARAFYRREGWSEQGDPLPVEALGLDVVALRRPL